MTTVVELLTIGSALDPSQLPSTLEKPDAPRQRVLFLTYNKLLAARITTGAAAEDYAVELVVRNAHRHFHEVIKASPLAAEFETDPPQDSTRALQEIAKNLKSQDSTRALQDISRSLKSIDSTLKRRD